jgi:thymidylate synthase (FAD)
MKIINQYVTILDDINEYEIMGKIEAAGRTCYKSESKLTKESSVKFVEMIIKRGHESVLEHVNITVRWITDRGVTHELVRHRIASYSQESTRYVNYKEGIEIIQPVDYEFTTDQKLTLACVEGIYVHSIEDGLTPQQARAFLPNCLKTEIVITMNLRQWRHFFSLRCAKAAHPQMRDMALQTQRLFQMDLPGIFGEAE